MLLKTLLPSFSSMMEGISEGWDEISFLHQVGSDSNNGMKSNNMGWQYAPQEPQTNKNLSTKHKKPPFVGFVGVIQVTPKTIYVISVALLHTHFFLLPTMTLLLSLELH